MGASAQDKQSLMAKIAADVHTYIAAAAAEAPPLVIHVEKGALSYLDSMLIHKSAC